MPDIHLGTLADVHELPWPEIEGAHVRVRQEVDNRDPLDPDHDDRQDLVTTEDREGELVGRTEGMGIRYDPHDGENYACRMGPTVYLETAKGTVLEVITDKPGNELLAYTPPEATDE